jgi:hypothetical protein
MADHAQRIAGAIPAGAVASGNIEAVRAAIAPEVTRGRLGLVEVYQLGVTGTPSPLVAVESPSMPRGHTKGIADRLAERVAAGGDENQALDPMDGGGELVRAGSIIREPATNRAVGVVIASGFLSGDLATHARKITDAYENYSQLHALRSPLQGVYLSLFLMMTLMILVSATWMGLYLAKRIPAGAAAAARAARDRSGASRPPDRAGNADEFVRWSKRSAR